MLSRNAVFQLPGVLLGSKNLIIGDELPLSANKNCDAGFTDV